MDLYYDLNGSLKNTFNFDNVEITSNFDSGNMINCLRINDHSYNILIGEDCYCINTPNKHSIYKTWFYFCIKSSINSTLSITVSNLNNFSKLFNEGYKIVYQDIMNKTADEFEKSYIENEEYLWKRLESEIAWKVDPNTNQLSITFDYLFSENNNVLFSFCYPWSYEKNLKFLDYIQLKAKANKTIYFHREVLTNSKEKRKVELLTISAKDNILKAKEYLFKGLFPNGNRCSICIHDKPIIFISARVHPGETPAAYSMLSIIKFLLSNDERAKVLIETFVFKIIPIINVDGLSRGHFRLDSTGMNLNRCYMDSEVKNDPEIYAIKKIFLYYSSEFKVRYYFDLHADMQCSGVYTFGNALTDFLDQVENVLFPFVFSLNCHNVNFPRCNFTEKSMKTKFKNEKHSKEATSRVFFYKKTGLIHTYTVESTYFRGCFTPNNEVPNSKIYAVEDFEKTGRDLLISILDYEEINPMSKLHETEYETIQGCRNYVANYIVNNEDRYKFELAIKAKAKDINSLKTWKSINESNSKQKEKLLKRKSLKRVAYPKFQFQKSFRANMKEIFLNEPNNFNNINDQKNIHFNKSQTNCMYPSSANKKIKNNNTNANLIKAEQPPLIAEQLPLKAEHPQFFGSFRPDLFSFTHKNNNINKKAPQLIKNPVRLNKVYTNGSNPMFPTVKKDNEKNRHK